jgi:thymidylate synthase (FAD)
MQVTMEMYDGLVENGVKKEDARYILPNATTTNIVVTMNARELLHFIELRSSPRAQWEIRELAQDMLKQLKEVAPVIFGSVVIKEE